MAKSSGRSQIKEIEIGQTACNIKLADAPTEGPPPKNGVYQLMPGHPAHSSLISLLMTCAAARVAITIWTKEDILADRYGVVDVIEAQWNV